MAPALLSEESWILQSRNHMESFGLTCLGNLIHIPPRLHTENDCAKPHFTCTFGRMNVRTGSDIFYEANKMCQNVVIHQRIEQILQERCKSSPHLCLCGFTFSFPIMLCVKHLTVADRSRGIRICHT